MRRLSLYLMLVMMAVSCGELSQGGAGNEAGEIVLTKSQQAVASQGDAFAVDYLKTAAEAFPGENLFVSPMSLSMLCCMLANGAEGVTYDEIVKALGMGGFTIDQVNDCYSTLVTALLKADRSVSLSLANSIWIAQGLSVRSKFKSRMDKTYDADTYVVDFTRDETLKKINGWCSDKTKGLIPQMFEELDPQVQMILINALYFKGSWTVQFPKDQTSSAAFHSASGQEVTTEFMQATSEKFTGYMDGKVTVVRMPYGNGAFLMEAVMPADKDFAGFIANLTKSQVDSWDRTTTEQVYLRFPKFKADFDTERELVPIMQKLGVKKPFTYAAEFGGMSETPLYVSNMRQKAFVSIDEEGTEAAAVTVAEMRKNGVADGPKITMMVFDRPFLYLIREKSTGAILFMGTKVK